MSAALEGSKREKHQGIVGAVLKFCDTKFSLIILQCSCSFSPGSGDTTLVTADIYNCTKEPVPTQPPIPSLFQQHDLK